MYATNLSRSVEGQPKVNAIQQLPLTLLCTASILWLSKHNDNAVSPLVKKTPLRSTCLSNAVCYPRSKSSWVCWAQKRSASWFAGYKALEMKQHFQHQTFVNIRRSRKPRVHGVQVGSTWHCNHRPFSRHLRRLEVDSAGVRNFTECLTSAKEDVSETRRIHVISAGSAGAERWSFEASQYDAEGVLGDVLG